MDLSSCKSRKVGKKLRKLQHVIFKETGVACTLLPTKNLVISNAGLVNGLSEEIIYEHFSKYGVLENIMLIPGKSCSFISYKDPNSALEAFENYNGKLNIAQDKKPVYLLYTDHLPIIDSDKVWNVTPPGLVVLENFISPEEEKGLLGLFDVESTTIAANQMKHRQVKHFGYEFRYDINNVDKDKPLEEKIPKECDYLWTRLQSTDFEHFLPDQLTINHYSPGQGIPHHIDTHSAFEDPIVSLSLKSPVIMDFKKDTKHFCVTLPQRSLAIMAGECRYDWTHGITPRKFDIIHSTNGFTSRERGTRVSLTFRKVLQGKCHCTYRSKCDSYEEQVADSEMGDKIASDLEKEHVHKVYENIALHFNDTRHKPWPNVLEFVMSFSSGSVLVDAGCGNGKYLGLNKQVFDLQRLTKWKSNVDSLCINDLVLIHEDNLPPLKWQMGRVLLLHPGADGLTHVVTVKTVNGNFKRPVIGCDRSFGLIDVCNQKGFEAFMANCLALPLRDNSVDGCLSIAVIHHFATEERRLRAIQEMVRILRIGGRALIYVWAKDQHKGKQKSAYIKQDRKNRGTSTEETVSSEINQEVSLTSGVTLPVHVNRTQFKHKDVLVPWKLKTENKLQDTFLRFYHVFDEKELENLCRKLNNVAVVKSYYDQGNWCIIIEKQ